LPGAGSYIHKTATQSELLLAVDAVLAGKRFISSSLNGYKFTESSAEKAPHRHEVLFYSDDTVLLDSLARFIAAALKGANGAIVLATKAHRDSLVQRLKAEAVDINDALHRGTYISLDAADTLSMIMVNDLPDPVRFFEGIGGFIQAASRAAQSEEPRVVVFGEAVALLHAEGKAVAAIRFEQLGNDLLKTHKVDILCISIDPL
jgi:MEDS: MEthanogen/methylotroph, DcmR Sensory domain